MAIQPFQVYQPASSGELMQSGMQLMDMQARQRDRDYQIALQKWQQEKQESGQRLSIIGGLVGLGLGLGLAGAGAAGGAAAGGAAAAGGTVTGAGGLTGSASLLGMAPTAGAGAAGATAAGAGAAAPLSFMGRIGSTLGQLDPWQRASMGWGLGRGIGGGVFGGR